MGEEEGKEMYCIFVLAWKETVMAVTRVMRINYGMTGINISLHVRWTLCNHVVIYWFEKKKNKPKTEQKFLIEFH